MKNHSKVAAYSVMMCIDADGTCLPPMTLFKSANGTVFQSWCEGGPEGATYAANKSGWFDMDKFNQWFKEVSAFISLFKRKTAIVNFKI